MAARRMKMYELLSMLNHVAEDHPKGMDVPVKLSINQAECKEISLSTDAKECKLVGH